MNLSSRIQDYLSALTNPKPKPAKLDVPPVVVSIRTNEKYLRLAKKKAKKGVPIALRELPVSPSFYESRNIIVCSGDIVHLNFQNDHYDFLVPGDYKKYQVAGVNALILTVRCPKGSWPVKRRIIVFSLILEPLE